MCLFNRPERLEAMLRLLDAQEDTPGIALYLWNNDRADHDFYAGVLRGFEASGALRSVRLVRSPYNLGSIARFYWARVLAERASAASPLGEAAAGPVIVIDDDEDVQSDFVKTALAVHRPGMVHAWWAFTVASDDYFDRAPAEVGGPVDHVGPGGMICDSAIFLDDRFFTELPQRYWLLDDLWFTHFAKTHGQTLAKLPVEIEFVLAETNQHWNLGDLKREFYLSLRG